MSLCRFILLLSGLVAVACGNPSVSPPKTLCQPGCGSELADVISTRLPFVLPEVQAFCSHIYPEPKKTVTSTASTKTVTNVVTTQTITNVGSTVTLLSTTTTSTEIDVTTDLTTIVTTSTETDAVTDSEVRMLHFICSFVADACAYRLLPRLLLILLLPPPQPGKTQRKGTQHPPTVSIHLQNVQRLPRRPRQRQKPRRSQRRPPL